MPSQITGKPEQIIRDTEGDTRETGTARDKKSDTQSHRGAYHFSLSYISVFFPIGGCRLLVPTDLSL